MKSMHCKLPSGENFKAKVRDNSTIRTVREELSRQIKIPESYINLNISNRIRNLQNPTPIRSLGINPSDNIDVTFIPPRLSFQYGKTAPFSLPFQINSTIENAKKMLAPRYHVSPETIKLSLYNIELANNQLLRNIRIPINRHIQINIEKPKSKSALLFMMQHEAYRLEFPDETTVAQIKDELMRHADKATISIQLLYNGLYLDDNAVLKHLNINPKSCIIVESEMLEREDFILENNSFDDDNDMDSFLDNKTHAARARTAIMKRRREMRQLSKQCNSNLTSSTKVPIVQPDFSKTAPTTQRVQKRARGGQNSLSKTLSGSLKNSQDESEIEEEEESEPLVEQQSIDKLTEQQSNELLGESQSFDRNVIPQNISLDKIGSGQNIPNVAEDENENAGYAKSSTQNSADLTDIVGSLTKIAQSGSNVIDENHPVMMARGMPESNEPATLEDSIPVGDDNQDEAGQPATLEDSIPVENVQDDAANQPMTLEEPVPPDEPEDANQPSTLEDSIPVNDNGEPYEQSADDDSNLSGLISGNASGLVKNDNETEQNETQREGCEQQELVEDFNDTSEQEKPAAATRSIKPLDNEPATLEDSIPVGGDDQENSNDQEGSGLSNVLSAVASGLAGSNEANGEDETANQPATLEDSVPVGGDQEEANQPATLEDSVPVGGDQDEAAGEPATLEEQASSGLSNLLPGVANALTSNDNDNGDGEDEQAAVSRDIAEDEKVDDEAANEPATLEDSVPVEDAQERDVNEPATLEETAPEDQDEASIKQASSGLSNLLSGVASGLTNSMDNGNEAAEENQDEAGQPATLEDSVPVEDAQERDVNEPATLEEKAPEDQDEASIKQASSGLSNLLSGVASGLTNSMDNANEQAEDAAAAADGDQTEERSKTLELAEAEEGGNGEDQGGQAAGPDLSQLIKGRADDLTEENESNNQSGGGGLSSLITGNAQALTGNNDNNNDDNADGNNSKGPLDLSGMVNSLL